MPLTTQQPILLSTVKTPQRLPKSSSKNNMRLVNLPLGGASSQLPHPQTAVLAEPRQASSHGPVLKAEEAKLYTRFGMY